MNKFLLEQIKVLHIEPTTMCNASCPQCDRENIEHYDDTLHRTNLTLQQVQDVIPKSVVKNLDKMFMCGIFGDPAAGKHTLEIYKWFRSLNPNITLGMNTNGGLKNTEWWEQIADLFNQPQDYVVFSIDGLADTNHIYRRNVLWKKVLQNASAFINRGGSAHWDMLVFEHNQHQVDQAEQLARDLGFSWFRAKVSKRFLRKPVEFLQTPKGWHTPNVEKPDTIRCHALQEKSMYIGATGKLLPCCWMGTHLFNTPDDLQQALDSDNFQQVINSWDTKPLSVCERTCGTTKNTSTSFDNQWQREVQLQ